MAHTKEIECIELGRAILVDDFLEIWVPILEVPNTMQNQIECTVQQEKASTHNYMMEIYGRDWKATEITHVHLSVMVWKNKPLETKVIIEFEELDAEEGVNPADKGIMTSEYDLDLSAYIAEIRKLIHKAIDNTFFSTMHL